MARDKSENSSWLQSLPEEYGDENDVTGRRMVFAGITVVVLAIFGGVIWYSYMSGNDKGPVPVIKADRSVIKVKPEEPGGMEVPDQDKHVYDNITRGESAAEDELGASAEIPLERPVEEATEAADTDNMAQQIQEDLPPAPPVQVESSAEALSPTLPQQTSGDFLIQVGAFAEKARAELHWNNLLKKHNDIFTDLSADYMQVDLGNKGIFYRVRGGMIASRAEADDLCNILKSRKQACLVVKK